VLSPSEIAALVSTIAGSIYGAKKNASWPDTFPSRLVVGMQSSTVLLVVFASMGHLSKVRDAGMTAGVSYTRYVSDPAFPVLHYFVIGGIFLIFFFEFGVLALHNRRPAVVGHPAFLWFLSALYFVVCLHALTVPIVPVPVDSL
jgi:hypothetical protein